MSGIVNIVFKIICEGLYMDKNEIAICRNPFKYELDIDIKAVIKTLEERFKSVPILGDILVFKEKRENIVEMNGINRAIDNIEKNIKCLIEANRVDLNYIEKCQKEVYFIFKFFLNAVYNQPNEEFIDYLSHYLCNCINEEFSDVKIKVTILNRVTRYTKQHIDVLKSIYEDSKEHGWPGDIKNDNYNWQKQIENIPNIEPFLIKLCFHDLVNDGFLFQKLGAYNFNTFSPYEIIELGVICLKMVGIKLT